MARNRRSYSREQRNRNYSWQPFFTTIPNAATGSSFLITTSSEQDYDTVLERIRGVCWSEGSAHVLGLVFAMVVPKSFIGSTTTAAALPSEFPVPTDADETDDYPLFKHISGFEGLNEGSMFDSKAKRKIEKDSVVLVAFRPNRVAPSRSPIVITGRMLVRWEN